jgi:hypothetical protein
VSFDRSRVERQHDGIFATLGQRFKDGAPSSALGPTIEAIVDRRVRTVFTQTVAPSPTRLQHVNDAADDAPIVSPFWPRQPGRQMGADTRPVPRPGAVPTSGHNPWASADPTSPECVGPFPPCILAPYERRRSISRQRIEFLDFMNDIVAAWPNQAIHVVLDNLNTHNPRMIVGSSGIQVTFHFTPTRFMAQPGRNLAGRNLVLHSTKKSLRDESFTSVKQLREHIDAFIDDYNVDAKPYVWTKSEVYQKVSQSTFLGPMIPGTAWLDQFHPNERAILAKPFFNAKEAFYKCQSHTTRTFLDFQDVTLDLEIDSGAFQVIFLTQEAPHWNQRRQRVNFVTLIDTSSQPHCFSPMNNLTIGLSDAKLGSQPCTEK